MQDPTVISFFLFAVVLGLVQNVLLQETPAEFKARVYEKCREEGGLTEEHIEGLFNTASIEGLKNHKCYVKCLLENYQILKSDGTMDVDLLSRAVQVDYNTPEKQAKGAEVGRTCGVNEKKLADKCEYSFNIAKCIVDHAVKMDLTHE